MPSGGERQAGGQSMAGGEAMAGAETMAGAEAMAGAAAIAGRPAVAGGQPMDGEPPPPIELPDVDLFQADREAGHPGFASPHSKPIGLLPDHSRVYVANTSADTVDVFEAQSGTLLTVSVGVDGVHCSSARWPQVWVVTASPIP